MIGADSGVALGLGLVMCRACGVGPGNFQRRGLVVGRGPGVLSLSWLPLASMARSDLALLAASVCRPSLVTGRSHWAGRGSDILLPWLVTDLEARVLGEKMRRGLILSR
jgi:hypothetical protein